jgi:Shelterin complex subunit, TPP1/ACD
MSQVFSFENPRLKPALAAYLNSGCDFSEVPAEQKRPIRVYVHENIPKVWLSDGHQYLEARFTKDAMNDFRKNHSTTKFSGLKDKMMLLSRWRLAMSYEDSRLSQTSY